MRSLATSLALGLLFSIATCVSEEENEKPDSTNHGRTEMERFLSDRPFARIYRDKQRGFKTVSPDDDIYSWAASRFAPAHSEIRIWDNEPPELGLTNDAIPATATAPISILVRQSTALGADEKITFDFERLWFELVSALCRAETMDEWDKLASDAIAGKISKADFVEKFARIAFAWEQARQNFYITVWKPWTDRVHFVSDPKLWGTSPASDFDAWWKASSKEMRQYYEDEFDRLASGKQAKPQENK